MKHILPFILNENLDEISSYGRMITDELDRLGISWNNEATPRQRKNGTLVLKFSVFDAIKLIKETDWFEGMKPLVRDRIFKVAEEFEKLEDTYRPYLEAMEKSQIESETINKFLPDMNDMPIRFYIYSTYFSNSAFDRPEPRGYGKILPSAGPADLKKVRHDFLNYGIRKTIYEKYILNSVNRIAHFWFSLINASRSMRDSVSIFSTAKRDPAWRFINAFGIENINRDLNIAQLLKQTRYFNEIPLRQEDFDRLMQNPDFPTPLKADIRENPYYLEK